jgi:hypothetical protein
MKAMTWLKIGGCALAALAALAAADTRFAEVTAQDPRALRGHVIASPAGQCPMAHSEKAHGDGCCAKKEAKADAEPPAGCCKK